MTARTLALLLLLCLRLSAPAAAEDAARQTARTTQAFLSAVAHYHAGDYRQAADRFAAIAAGGVVNATLYYNLANACLKSGDIGRAVLWYERALELTPRDPDLRFNYAAALSLLKDQREDSGNIFRILFFWKYQMGENEILWAAVVFNAVFWLLSGVRLLRSKRPLNIVALLVLGAAVVMSATVAGNFYRDRYPDRAVVLGDRVSVRSGWTPEATELFVLHAGTRVRVEADNGKFLKICFAPGKIGWVPRAEVETI